ncbi:MAG TPA: dolichyl-phosphate beta-glucosyltransferase [Patescibacteria group bacterium]|nr:dolichyl-phosphate beta-glucosyltransferase [Patescibacteria group bacterium]
MSKNIHLTVLIPCYNEAKVIKENLTEISEFLSSKNYEWELLVVDDGSRDNSVKKVLELKNPKIKLVSYKINRGKGGALKEGIAKSSGRYIIFMDADLSVPVETIDAVLDKLEEGKSDVVIGTRKIKSAKVLVHQPWLRENLGKGFTFITRIITGVKISDFTCGFKGFSGVSAKKIFSNSLLTRWAYDAEILYLAKKFGYKIFEVPVTWTNRKDTRVKLWNAVVTSFTDLIRIKLNDWSGKYGEA